MLTDSYLGLRLPVLFLIVVLLAACRPATETDSIPTTTTTLQLSLSHDPPTFDPHRTSDPASSVIFGQVCQPLIGRTPTMLEAPLLAESWLMAEDGRSLTLNLRQDVTFHDGTPFNAEAVRFTFSRIQHPDSVLSPLHDALQGVEIETPDEYTVRFVFEQPQFDFVATLQNVYAVIVSPTAVEADEEAFGRNPVCTGPYQIAEWQPDQYVLLARYEAFQWPTPNFENQGPARIHQLQFHFIDAHETRYLALLNGEIDTLSLARPEEIAEIRSMPEQFTLYESWAGGINYLGFNYQRSPTDETAVRQAIAHAINKEAISQALSPDTTEPTFSPLAPNVFGYAPELAPFEYGFDPERSRELLVEAGFNLNNDGLFERDGQPLRLELLTVADSNYADMFTFIQSQLREVGIAVEMRAVTPGEIAAITPTGEFDLLLYHYFWPFPSALPLFLGSERVGASNRVAYSNAEVDALLTQAFQTPSGTPEQAAVLFEAQQLILQDAPWQPLLAIKSLTAVNNRVQGVVHNPDGGLLAGILLHDAYIVEE